MAKRHKPEEIIAKLRQVEVMTGQGTSMADAIRSIGVTEVTYYRWRSEYGGMKLDQVKRLKELEVENARLRKAVSDLTLDKLILKEASWVEVTSASGEKLEYGLLSAGSERTYATGKPLDAAQGASGQSRRGPPDSRHRSAGARLWALRLSADHSPAERGGLGRERVAGRPDLATRGAEGSGEAT